MTREFKSLPRLFIPAPMAAGGEMVLEEAQANYLVNVLRMGPGDVFITFNGKDGAWRAELTEAKKRAGRARLVEQIAAQTPASTLWFGFAPLKTARLDYLVQKATEMGAGAIQPVITRYTQAKNLRADKLEANIIEAAEQCEILSVPELLPETGLMDLLARWPLDHAGAPLIFCDEAAAPGGLVPALTALGMAPVGILVGPEGGFAPEEREALLALPYVVPVSLGPRILRADTAAVAALAVVQAIIGDWR